MTHVSLRCASTMAAILLVPGSLFADQQGVKGEGSTSLASQATISIDQAVRAARDKFAVTVVKAELEEEDGKTVWEIELVTSDGKTREVYVDAVSGEVLEVEEDED